jgi:hypothetical protein
MTRTFTNQSKKDIPEGMSEEEHTRMYAAFGKVVELLGSAIEWNHFIDYDHPEDYVVSVEDDGSMIMETIIKIRYLREADDDKEPQVSNV